MGRDFVHPLELGFLVDFINAFASEPRTRAGIAEGPYPTLGHLAAHAPISRAIVRDIPEQVAHAALIRLADRLYALFASSLSSPDDALAMLNGFLSGSSPLPHASQIRGRAVADWLLRDVNSRGQWSTRTLQAASALALHEWLTSAGSLDRLGICSAHGCADVYVDGSQAGSRRFCSTACGNRTKVAAHRARRRASAAATR